MQIMALLMITMCLASGLTLIGPTCNQVHCMMALEVNSLSGGQVLSDPSLEVTADGLCGYVISRICTVHDL